MRIIDRDNLPDEPAGTFYSHVVEGKYAEGIYLKKETDGDGWWKLELLPQRTMGRPIPWFQPETWCPREGMKSGEVVFVYETADVAQLVASLGGKA